MPPPPPRRPDSKTGSGAGAASKEENIYIPSFISKRPFYAGEEGDEQNDYLEHQRLQKKNEQSQWYDRGRKAGPAATKYRKGACENCGAMTHKAKDCLSRPRAKGAKWTGRDIQADEVIQDVKLGWDAKRDRWNGYDSKEYRSVVEDFNQMEELRKKALPARDDEEDEGANDGDKYAEENDMSKHQITATRQLRLREDTAKYLLNLDLDSAKYDPKTRALIDGGATNDKAADMFAEEGFMRASGDAGEFEKAQNYAWEAQEKTGDTSQHLQANPTAGQFYRKKQLEEAEKKRIEKEKKLLEMYGDDSQYKMPDEYAFSRNFRQKGMIKLSTYLRQYRVGDIVDIKANGAVQKGMPHKVYHGKTGVVYNVSKSAVGIIIYKKVKHRYIEKRINIRVEHISPSRSRDDFLRRVKENARLRKEAQAEGKTVLLKRLPVAPRDAHTISLKENVPETVTPLAYETTI
ncbi:hypothetical protein BN1723_010524 [Verticillium longisporum]|uniref:Pre-mRNA-splicing factor SLU7 n=2 Tax=Verticillium longisporum TaxID=100787 RepID=A0A0G4KZF8_VERLO|nr:hypothetical protein BN1723_010524 [Verticillium longisporum]